MEKMNREELKALGLTDEQIESVIKSHGKVVQDNKEKADKLIEKNKTRISELEKENKTLSDGSDADAELKKKYDELETKYNSTSNELTGIKKNKVLSDAIAKAGGNDASYIQYLLEKDGKLELSDDGTIAGLDDKLKALKDSDAKYFNGESGAGDGDKGGKGGAGSQGAAGFTTIKNDLNGGGTPSELEQLEKQVMSDLGIK